MAVGQQHDVARMRVGVEHALLQHLLEEGAQQRVGELHAVGDARGAPVDLAHARPVEPLHHEDTRRAEVLVHVRHADVRVGGHGRRDGARVARLDPVVELLPEARRELGDEVVDPVLVAPRGAGLDDVAELFEHREVDAHRLVDARPLHLHHDARAVGQLRPVHLADRRRRHRLPVEAGEDLGQRGLELLLQHLGDGVARRRAHVVLEHAQLGGGLRRDEVGAGGEDLPELHEHAPALLQREAQAAHGRPVGRGLDLVLAPEPERRAEPVAHRDAGDLRVALHAPPAPPQRPDRVRHRLQARSAPASRSRAGRGTRATPPLPSRRAARTGTGCG